MTEAIELLSGYELGDTWAGQYFVAARTGDAAIIEIDVIHRKRGRFLVATNFYLSQRGGREMTCQRYKTAAAMLEGA